MLGVRVQHRGFGRTQRWSVMGVSGFFRVSACFGTSAFSWLKSVPLSGWTRFCLSIHLLVDTWAFGYCECCCYAHCLFTQRGSRLWGTDGRRGNIVPDAGGRWLSAHSVSSLPYQGSAGATVPLKLAHGCLETGCVVVILLWTVATCRAVYIFRQLNHCPAGHAPSLAALIHDDR